MGDSVASGEGTLYGYRYDPASQRWVGGNLNVIWPGPYPHCHDSPDAYGTVVAKALHARLAQFACSGSSFESGIEGPKTDYLAGVTVEFRPAQFGNWATRTDLNHAYDAARPDLVLITFGADDVDFTGIVKACIENRVEHSIDPFVDLQCTARDPGPTVSRDFTARIGALERDYATLIQWIEARGKADRHVPRVVFTTYYDPLPEGGGSCPDSRLLDTQQVSYLSGELTVLDQGMVTSIQSQDERNVAVVDLIDAFNGHRWCSTDPWAYGLSIYRLTDPASFLSQAPFHPTPAGQRAIAALVLPAVHRLFR